MCLYLCIFFFSSRRRHTRFDCDWSSDVCSSDLPADGQGSGRRLAVHPAGRGHGGARRPAAQRIRGQGGGAGMSVTELRPAAEVSDAPVVERIPTAMLPLPRPLRFRAAAVRTAGLLAFAYLFLTLPRTLSFAGPAYAIDFGLIVALAVLSASVVAWVGETSLATLAQMGMAVAMLTPLQNHGFPFAPGLAIVS